MVWEWSGLIGGGLALGAMAWLAALSRRRRRVMVELARGIATLGAGRPARPVQSHQVGGTTGRLARIFNDVAPRLEARVARLEGDRQLLRAVLGGMAEGVIAVDTRRRLLFANDAAERLFGLGPGAVGRLVAELIRSPRVQEAVDATLAGPGSHHAEVAIAGPDGWPRGQGLILSVQGTPLPGSPPAGALLVFHDVTETRRLERVRQDFVANASHELKTPLAAIKAFTETLLDGALHDDGVNVKFLQRIDEQTDRLSDLVLDLLSLARLESGQEVFRHAPLMLAPVVRQAADPYRDRAQAEGLSYHLEIAPEAATAVVLADEEAIRQVLDNLIDNAIKYTPEGGCIRVRLGLCDDDRGLGVVLEVVDSGIGIPREDLPRVFERFYRVDRARSRALGGTGLGLSIVKHVMGSLGGQIAVDSHPGAGTTFTVWLPLASDRGASGGAR